MARRTWTRCKCGVKLHVKKERRLCILCERKERRANG